LRGKLIKYADVIALFAISICIFTYLILQPSTDIAIHVQQILRINNHADNYPANFLFYFSVNLLSGFSNGNLIYAVTVVLLSLSTVAKYIISKTIITKLNKNNSEHLKLHYSYA
jgi:hypothetical protein